MRRVSELLQQYKKDEFGWGNVLNNHFNRCKELGGPSISSIQDSITITPAVGGEGFMCKLHTKNSLSQNDGNELMLQHGSPQRTEAAALDDVCRHAMVVLLLTDASAVLLHPKQWEVATEKVVQAVITTKKEFLALWTLPNHLNDNLSAFGDTLGDGPRAQPAPSSDAERADREKFVFDIITEECEEYGSAAPFQLHRGGRWAVLDALIERGTLLALIRDNRKFNIIQLEGKKWAIELK